MLLSNKNISCFEILSRVNQLRRKFHRREKKYSFISIVRSCHDIGLRISTPTHMNNVRNLLWKEAFTKLLSTQKTLSHQRNFPNSRRIFTPFQ